MRAIVPVTARNRRALGWLGILGLSLLLLPATARAQEGSVAAGAPRIDWLKPSNGAYPALDRASDIRIKVSLGRQAVEIIEGDRIIYTMVASTGLDLPADDRTPLGTYFIQRERGLSFFNARLGEGARYWVSWLNHGEYLFHSVPIDAKGRIIEEEAVKLGRKASHGCIRLTLADARWIYERILPGTKVVICP